MNPSTDSEGSAGFQPASDSSSRLKTGAPTAKPASTPISVVSLPANKGAPMKSLGALGDLFRK